MSEEATLESLAKDVAAIKKLVVEMRKGTDTRRRKDPDAPSRPLNPYFVFQKDARPKVKAELEKKLKNGQKAPNSAVNAELKRQWADIKENKPDLYKKFAAVAKAEKSRYEKEKAAFMAKKKAETDKDQDDGADNDSDAEAEEPVKEAPAKKSAGKSPKTQKAAVSKPAEKKPEKVVEKKIEKKVEKKETSEKKPVAKSDKKPAAKADKKPAKAKKEPEPEPEADDEVPGEDSNLSEIASLDSEAFSDDDLLEDL